MTSLENLRKQAKQFVRWHRDRRWTVAEVIRNTLPRYAGLSDGQILEAEFKLADAQELVARRSGFENWQALVAASHENATSHESAADADDRPSPAVERPLILVGRPFVFVRDVRAACAYYVETLGFELAFSYGTPLFYAEIIRDGVRLCIRHTDAAVIDPALARREDIVLASFEVTDAKALYLEFQSAGAVFSQTLRTEPYGTRDFIVDDPDGNRVLFFDMQRRPENHNDATRPG